MSPTRAQARGDRRRSVMAKYVAAIDQGTTSTRFMIFDHAGQVVGRRPEGARADLSPSPAGSSTTRSRSGTATREVIRRAGQGRHRTPATSRPSASPTSARRRSSGTARPASPSTTRSSGRTPAPTQIVRRARRATAARTASGPRSGLPLATYFSGPKIKWILDNVAGAARGGRARRSCSSATSTPGCIWNLTGGAERRRPRHRRDQRQPHAC